MNLSFLIRIGAGCPILVFGGWVLGPLPASSGHDFNRAVPRPKTKNSPNSLSLFRRLGLQPQRKSPSIPALPPVISTRVDVSSPGAPSSFSEGGSWGLFSLRQDTASAVPQPTPKQNLRNLSYSSGGQSFSSDIQPPKTNSPQNLSLPRDFNRPGRLFPPTPPSQAPMLKCAMGQNSPVVCSAIRFAA
jgi:hypothetical protein